MKPIIVDFDNNSSTPLYLQLYRRIREDVLAGEMAEGEKLPSLRKLARSLNVSITTVQLAYDQLLVEGYVTSRPQSGYYVSQVFPASGGKTGQNQLLPQEEETFAAESSTPYIYDPDCFDFNKWKKCSSRVFNDYSSLLLFESDPQGEPALRREIARYLFTSRGVSCLPEQIVIGAGTQQITSQLCRILPRMGVSCVCLESPGYLPVQNAFADRGFSISHVPVNDDGIAIEKLPINISTAVYVNPSNQFPTGAVMPVGRRRRLLQWAADNDSIIIEDDYDSELRYFGRPLPALRSLDDGGHTVYLGSFSSTLFPAIKISYAVLPPAMAEIFVAMKDNYAQTCSKAEQLTLALFMEEGYYYTGIRKLRSLYSQKLTATLDAFARCGGSDILPVNTHSGLNVTLKVKTKKPADGLCAAAKSIGLQMLPLSRLAGGEGAAIIFYYSKLPLNQIDALIANLAALWQEE